MFGFNKQKRYCHLRQGLRCDAENCGLCESHDLCEWQRLTPRYEPPAWQEFGYQLKGFTEPTEPPTTGSNAVKVEYAHWIKLPGQFTKKCSHCGYISTDTGKYCSECGKRMIGEI